MISVLLTSRRIAQVPMAICCRTDEKTLYLLASDAGVVATFLLDAVEGWTSDSAEFTIVERDGSVIGVPQR